MKATKAEQARRLLDDPIIQEAFKLIDDHLIADIRGCKPSDTETLYATKLQLNALDALQRYILGMAQSDKIENPTRG